MERPFGSFATGISAATKALAMMSLRAWCPVIFPDARLHTKLWTSYASTWAPHGHVWGTQRVVPYLRATAVRIIIIVIIIIILIVILFFKCFLKRFESVEWRWKIVPAERITVRERPLIQYAMYSLPPMLSSLFRRRDFTRPIVRHTALRIATEAKNNNYN